MNAKHRWPATIAVLGVGVAFGAVLGVLFAPVSGEEARDYMADMAQDGVDTVVSKGRKMARRAQKAVIHANEQVQDLTDTGERAFDQARRA